MSSINSEKLAIDILLNRVLLDYCNDERVRLYVSSRLSSTHSADDITKFFVLTSHDMMLGRITFRRTYEMIKIMEEITNLIVSLRTTVESQESKSSRTLNVENEALRIQLKKLDDLVSDSKISFIFENPDLDSQDREYFSRTILEEMTVINIFIENFDEKEWNDDFISYLNRCRVVYHRVLSVVPKYVDYSGIVFVVDRKKNDEMSTITGYHIYDLVLMLISYDDQAEESKFSDQTYKELKDKYRIEMALLRDLLNNFL